MNICFDRKDLYKGDVPSLLDIDECNSSPCQNDGTCTDQVNGYACACVAGYTGADCQTGECLYTAEVNSSIACYVQILNGFLRDCQAPFQ